MHAERDRITGTEWWRASEYEVVGRTHIAPVEGAELIPYDPFEGYEEFWGGRKPLGRVPAPYAELETLDLTDPWNVVGWCNRHGLLGILPHQTMEAHFWPRWEAALIPAGGIAGGPSPTGLGGVIPVQVQYRQGSGTEAVRFDYISRTHGAELRPLTEDEIAEVRESQWHEGFRQKFEPPGVRKLNVWYGGIEGDSLVRGYARFFPRVPGVTDWEARQRWGAFPEDKKPHSPITWDDVQELEEELTRRRYPTPYSEQFLGEYGEPIHRFRAFAQIIGNAVRVWHEARIANSREELYKALSYWEERESVLLPSQSAGLRPVHPSAALASDDNERGGFRWDRRWWFPSLYAALHKMILDDFAFRGAYGKYCEKCDSLFITGNPRKLYCEEKCRKAQYQNERRARRRAEGKRPS